MKQGLNKMRRIPDLGASFPSKMHANYCEQIFHHLIFFAAVGYC